LRARDMEGSPETRAKSSVLCYVVQVNLWQSPRILRPIRGQTANEAIGLQNAHRIDFDLGVIQLALHRFTCHRTVLGANSPPSACLKFHQIGVLEMPVRLLCLLGACLIAALLFAAPVPAQAPPEMRACWVSRFNWTRDTEEETKARIRDSMETLARNNVNAV